MKLIIYLKKLRVVILLSVTAMVAVTLGSLFNMSSDLSVEDAERRIRVYLTREMSEQLIKVNNEHPASSIKERLLSNLAEDLKKINAIEIRSIEVRKLIPDIFTKPHEPTFIARVEMQTVNRRFPPRYFWLPWSNIDSETNETAWYFAL